MKALPPFFIFTVMKRKIKRKFIGSAIYCPKKTILSNNLPEHTINAIYKLNPNLFESVKPKKNTELSEQNNG